MRCTVILTEQTSGDFYATALGFTGCSVTAKSRDEALRSIHECISKLMSHSEFVQLDIATEPKKGDSQQLTPWEAYGIFKDDSTWEELFDEIERLRDSEKG